MSPLPVPDWARVFDVAPAPFLLLTPDLVIVHANRARLEATATTLEATVGRHLFDAFPMPPDDPTADGLRNLRASPAEARDRPRRGGPPARGACSPPSPCRPTTRRPPGCATCARASRRPGTPPGRWSCRSR